MIKMIVEVTSEWDLDQRSERKPKTSCPRTVPAKATLGTTVAARESSYTVPYWRDRTVLTEPITCKSAES